jgi:hypothetical protein
MDSLLRVIMGGVPAYGLTSPTWTDIAEPAPSGHFFLPAGTRVYRSDLPDSAKGNYLTVHQSENATRRAEDDPRYWLLPFEIKVLWMRQLTDDQTSLLSQFLEQFFSVGFAEGSVIHQAKHYLSSTDFHVFDIRDITVEPITQNDGWRTALTVNFTLFCAGKHTPA